MSKIQHLISLNLFLSEPLDTDKEFYTFYTFIF